MLSRPKPLTWSTTVVEPVARDQVTNAVEVFCRPAAGQNGHAVLAQKDVLAQEPPDRVILLTDGICGERQPDDVLLQQLDAVVVRVEEVAEPLIRLQGLGQHDLDETEGKTLQPVLPPLGALVGKVRPYEHRRVVILKAVEEDAPGCGSLVLMTEDQGLLGIIHIQLGRAEQHIVVARKVSTAPEQQIRLTQRRRQPDTQPLLGSGQIGLRPPVTALQGTGPVGSEALDEAPCTTTAFDASGKGRSKFELLCHAGTISVPPIRPLHTPTRRRSVLGTRVSRTSDAQRQRGLTEQAANTAVDQACRMLRLPTIRAQFPELAEKAEREQMSYLGFLAELLLAECDDRARRRSERRIKAAGFPRDKSLRKFDFDTNPNLDAAMIHTLAKCEWIKKGLPICLIGDSGTGKSHLLMALGTEAAMAGYRVKYVLATKLVNELVEAADEKQLTKTIARYGRVDLLCIDELGYMERDRRGAELLFQVLTEKREEKNSVAIASNESFSQWGQVFGDEVLATAILDRLLHHCDVISINGPSYRLKNRLAAVERDTDAG